MTDEQLQQIRTWTTRAAELAGRATDGPLLVAASSGSWWAEKPAGERVLTSNCGNGSDLYLFAHARSIPHAAILALVGEVERVRADAALGALVRGMRDSMQLRRNPFYSGGDFDEWEVEEYKGPADGWVRVGNESCPEAALRAALGRQKEDQV